MCYMFSVGFFLVHAPDKYRSKWQCTYWLHIVTVIDWNMLIKRPDWKIEFRIKNVYYYLVLVLLLECWQQAKIIYLHTYSAYLCFCFIEMASGLGG